MEGGGSPTSTSRTGHALAAMAAHSPTIVGFHGENVWRMEEGDETIYNYYHFFHHIQVKSRLPNFMGWSKQVNSEKHRLTLSHWQLSYMVQALSNSELTRLVDS